MGIGSVGGGLLLMQKTFPEEFESMKDKMAIEFKKSANNKESDKEKQINFDLERKRLHAQKVEEVNNLMRFVAETNGRDPETIKLSAENIVNMCEKHNFSLPLLLAQAHLESHFGTTSRARRTNSVFSIGSYDDGRNVYKPSTQDESVENYILTIKNYYLADKTLDELLSNGGFVNHRGQRYASDRKYEQKIRQTMNGLIKTHCPSCF
jgi:flagellum-specific peptidoglycan hydrolase FlgJ